MDCRRPWQRLDWALPWLLFLGFPLADLVYTERLPLTVPAEHHRAVLR
jgi:hypothetical protein